MEGLVRPGARAWVSAVAPESKRKLRFTLELIESEGLIVGANTNAPNDLASSLLSARLLPGLKRYRKLRREVPYGTRSRVDFLLEGKVPHYVEVKNCHLVYPDRCAYFPDSVSVRAAAHLRELSAVCRDGAKATALFVVQREDARSLRPSSLHDPEFAAAARRAAADGVSFRAVIVRPAVDAYYVEAEIPVDLSDYDVAPLEGYREALLPYSGWKRRGKAKSVEGRA